MSGTVKPPGPVKKNEMNKALDAGSALAGPANLSQGAALGKEELEKKMQKAGQSGVDPQSGNDPGASRINKPLRSKDSRVQVLAPHINIGKSEDLRKDASNPKLAPKDVKVKQLQTQIDAGTYKPDANKIAGSMLQHPEKPLKGTKVQKSEWLQRAEAEYASWNKRERFETFMQKRLPHLTRSEIQVIGQTMLLQKSLKQEKLLKDFYNPSMLRSEKNKK
jgi:anti-sigma28 factor (negative regulator of flagellin synthesis)